MKIAALLLAALAAVPVASAQQPNPSAIRQRVMKMAVARVEGRLNMTEAQREEAKSILKNEEPAILALAARARQEHDELTAMQAFDDARVRGLAQKYADTNADILVERTRVRLELRTLLNDAQRAQLDKLRARIGKHFDEHLGEGLDSFIDAI